ncbi:MAG: hypothetical protein ACI395_02465 [Candidatus Cryptobacteroides sp.]
MKRRFFFVAAVVILAALSSCQKEDIDYFAGTYNYKTSGSVALMPSDYLALNDEEKAALAQAGISYEPTWVALSPEQGQMHIVVDDADGGTVLLTFNSFLGNGSSAEASVTDDRSITINGAPEKSATLTDGSQTIGGGFVIFSGSGRRYDDVLRFTLKYEGVFVVEDKNMTVVDSKVECLATRY